MEELTPRRIVEELDKYIIGQTEAKRCVAIALRNRWRRQNLPLELRDEVAPKNILMIGPTGVGKTEIARRLANLVDAPFLKVEASRYTEIGYHGRDVESMMRDLVELSVGMIRQKHNNAVSEKAKKLVEERILDMLLPSKSSYSDETDERNGINEKNGTDEKIAEPNTLSDESAPTINQEEIYNQKKKTREKLRRKLREGKLDDRMIELNVEDKATPVVEIFSNAGIEQMGLDFQSMFDKIIPSRTKRRKISVSEAQKALFQEELEKLVDREKIVKEAMERAENMGIIFIDEIDKIAGKEHAYGPDVSREGVQRDLLPIVEGSTVVTRYGMAKTDHVLFIAAGAFNVARPSDLIPELQGRFPIRVEFKALDRSDFVKILTEPKNALIRQYKALLETENVKLTFEDEAIEEIAKICEEVNQKTQNIGARRLHTVMEKLLELISFEAPELAGTEVKIDAKMVRDRLMQIAKDEDLSRYIL